MIVWQTAQFSPQRAGEITGIAPQHQRVWRQRGVLRDNVERSRSFSITDLARLMLIAEISRCETSLSVCSQIADAACVPLARHVLDADFSVAVESEFTDAEIAMVVSSISTSVKPKFAAFDGNKVRLAESMETVLDGSVLGAVTVYLPHTAKKMRGRINGPLVWMRRAA